jgi:hypothetical protein
MNPPTLRVAAAVLAAGLALAPAPAAAAGGKATASSTLAPDKKVSYGAENLGDGKDATAWCEGVPGLGVGEWVEIPVYGEPYMAITIHAAPGHRFSKKVRAANSEPAELEVQVLSQGKILDRGPAKPFCGEDGLTYNAWTKQGETFPADVRVRFVITKVRRGSAYEDTCISAASASFGESNAMCPDDY